MSLSRELVKRDIFVIVIHESTGKEWTTKVIILTINGLASSIKVREIFIKHYVELNSCLFFT